MKRQRPGVIGGEGGATPGTVGFNQTATPMRPRGAGILVGNPPRNNRI
jgi:hypothetical protein